MKPDYIPTQNPLLALFSRYAALSQYWRRNGTPDDLAARELQERHRLEIDLIEGIKRLACFAELGSDAMFERYAAAKAKPTIDSQGETPTELINEALDVKESQEPPAGEGWRWLKPGEIIEKDDMIHSSPVSLYELVIGLHVAYSQFYVYRRRVTPSTKPE